MDIITFSLSAKNGSIDDLQAVEGYNTIVTVVPNTNSSAFTACYRQFQDKSALIAWQKKYGYEADSSGRKHFKAKVHLSLHACTVERRKSCDEAINS